MSATTNKTEIVGDSDVGVWKPWAALAHARPLIVRSDLKATFFLGSKYAVGDAREIFQGDGHRNQLVALAINGEVAERMKRAVNCHDDLLSALRLIDKTFSRLQATEDELAAFRALDAAIAKATAGA